MSGKDPHNTTDWRESRAWIPVAENEGRRVEVETSGAKLSGVLLAVDYYAPEEECDEWAPIWGVVLDGGGQIPLMSTDRWRYLEATR